MPGCLCACHAINKGRTQGRCLPDSAQRGKGKKKTGFAARKANKVPEEKEANANKNISTGLWTVAREATTFQVQIIRFCNLPDGSTHTCTKCYKKWKRHLSSDLRSTLDLEEKSQKIAKGKPTMGHGDGEQIDLHALGR